MMLTEAIRAVGLFVAVVVIVVAVPALIILTADTETDSACHPRLAVPGEPCREPFRLLVHEGVAICSCHPPTTIQELTNE